MSQMIRATMVAVFICVAGFAAMPQTADAFGGARFRDLSIDFGVASSGSPTGDWDAGIGQSVGITYRMGSSAGLRISAASHRFNGVGANSGAVYTRVPLFLGGRFYFWNIQDLWSIGEVGIEISMDKTTADNAKVNSSAAVMYGMLYEITPSLFVGADVRMHMVKDSYWSYGFFLGGLF